MHLPLTSHVLQLETQNSITATESSVVKVSFNVDVIFSFFNICYLIWHRGRNTILKKYAVKCILIYDFLWALNDGSSPIDKLKDDNLWGKSKYLKKPNMSN